MADTALDGEPRCAWYEDCWMGDYLDDAPESIPYRIDRTEECDVIVAGGSTAALAAALTSAREGALTCLLEPTDWVGGQITAGGVPAIDFAWHSVGSLPVGAIAKNPANLPAEFVGWMDAIGNPGSCWVSKNCFRPDAFHDVPPPIRGTHHAAAR